MTLWSIARSPLIFGGDARHLDAATRTLLTNAEVIAVDQTSIHNRPLFNRDGLVGWTADVPGALDKYLALFNTRDQMPLDPARAAYRSSVISRAQRSTPVDVDVRGAAILALAAGDGGDGNAWDHAIWAEPRLVMADGSERKLTDLFWRRASAGYGVVARDTAPDGGKLSIGHQPVAYGISAHANSVIVYDLPNGVVRFRATAALNDSADAAAVGGTVQFLVYALPQSAVNRAPGVTVAVPLADLGLHGAVRVRDLWAHRNIATARGRFVRAIAWHGAGLYRLSPVTPASR